jgi:hypothetical protein
LSVPKAWGDLALLAPGQQFPFSKGVQIGAAFRCRRKMLLAFAVLIAACDALMPEEVDYRVQRLIGAGSPEGILRRQAGAWEVPDGQRIRQ